MSRPAYVGDSVLRREDARLLHGHGRYVADVKLPRMAHMAVVRSPHAHARIVRVDASAALAYPQVLAVVTFDDIRDAVGSLPCIDLYPDSKPALHTVLADGKVRYVGEPVAAVVATDPYVAEDARDLVDVEYEPLAAVLDAEQAAAEGAPLLYEDLGTNLVNTIHQEVGDVDAVFAEADGVYAETFRIHRYAGVPMETRGVVAEADIDGGALTVYTSTQFPHLARGFLASVLSMPESSIRVIAPDVGGGFGVKCEFYSEEVLVPLLALRLGRPVRWIEDRTEHMVATTHAREQIHHVEAAVAADGTVTAVKVRSYTNNGAALFTLATTPASIFSAMLRGPYRIPSYHAESHSVVTNKTPLAVYRGAGHPQATLCMERMMDIIAADRGVDPADLRRRNMLTSNELPADRGTEIVLAGKVVYDSGDYPRCLDMALDLMDYEAFRAGQTRDPDADRLVGIGISCFVEETSIGPYEFGTVRVDGSGQVTVLTGASPHGQGTSTALAQVVADELEIDIEHVKVVHGDTDVVPDGIGTFASRAGAIAGTVSGLAAQEVRRKALELAGHVLEIAVEDLEWTDGRAQVKGDPQTGLTLAEIAQQSTAWNQLPEGMAFNLEATHHFQVPGIAFANATHIAVVEIDRRTGELEISRYGVVHDCGRVINPMIVEGQVHGGVAQGIGGTLLEELTYDDAGQPLCTTFMDYLLPAVDTMPHIETDHLESPTPLNPYGMKGAGEGGATGSPAAVVNAIADALAPLGIKLTDDGPYSPSRIRALIREHESSPA